MEEEERQIPKGTKKVLKKMCKYVGARYAEIDFNKDNWYADYSWTLENENDFVGWLTKQIRTNKEIRRTTYELSFKPSKELAKKMAQAFVFNHGWICK